MSFLNAALAFGAFAFTVPLAIHLLFKSRYRRVDWGAMHLLDSVIRINRRRMQWLQLLLLLVRCSLPILLAFCLARPVLTGFRALPGDDPQTLVLALDVSRSMSARQSIGGSRIDGVKQQLTEALADMSRQDEVILVASNRMNEPAVRMSPQQAAGQLRKLHAIAGPVDTAQLLRAAIDAADQASHAQRRVVLVSDFQNQNLDAATMNSLSRVASNWSEKSVRPAVSFWHIGGQDATMDNVSVDSVEIDSPAVVAGRSARYTARIRNATDLPLRDVRVVWEVDGAALAPMTVSIAPRATRAVRLNHVIDQVGVHELALSVEQSDVLIADNRRSIAVDVIREVNVLVVDGNPSNRPLGGEADFLAIALSPFAFGSMDQPDAVKTSVIRPNELTARLNQGRGRISQEGRANISRVTKGNDVPDIVVLANVPNLTDRMRSILGDFVSGGGALVLFDGDRVNAAGYNASWGTGAMAWTLPAMLGKRIGQPPTQMTISETPNQTANRFPIGDHNSQYTPWRVLGSPQQHPFAKVDVYAYRRLNVGTGSPTIQPQTSPAPRAPDRDAVVLLRMANGDPIVVMGQRGRGRVVQFAVPCNPTWTSLPLRVVFVPMLQQLVLDLAGSGKPMSIDVGQPFTVALSELESMLPEGVQRDPSEKPTFTVDIPAGSQNGGSFSTGGSEKRLFLQPVADPSLGTSEKRLVVDQTPVPGTYRIGMRVPLVDEHPAVVQTMRVVSVPAVESQLRAADPARLSAAADAVQASVFTDLASLQEADRTRRFGREVWRWLLIALVVFMIAEMALQQRSIGAKPAGAESVGRAESMGVAP